MATTKDETITIRVTPEEKAKIKELAEAADQTVSKWLYRNLISNLNLK